MSYLYKNSGVAVEERTADLLSRMNLQEKLAQLRNCVIRSAEDAIVKGGKVIFRDDFKQLLNGTGAGSLQCLTRCDFWTKREPENGFDRRNCAKIVNAVQKHTIEHSRWGIPLLLFDDCRHGVPGPDATVFPAGIALSSSWNQELLRQVAQVIGEEMRTMGVTVSVGPNLNLARDPRWSRMEETYGEDSWLAGTLGKAYVQGMQTPRNDQSLTAVAAIHFVCGMGDSENGLDGRPVSMGPRELQEIFRPFGMAVQAGAAAAMASYSSIDGVPCHANREILTKLMREQYGFRGLIEGDAVGVYDLKERHRMNEDESYCVAAAMNAGLNVDLYCASHTARYTEEFVNKAIKSGKLKPEIIDELVRDVLRVKFELGLFENAYVNEECAVGTSHSESHRKLALDAARQSIILLSNANGTLPLDGSTGGRIALIGPHADNIYNLLGDYTPFVDRSDIITPLDGLKKVAPGNWHIDYAPGCGIKSPLPSGLTQALAIAEKADYLIMTLGGSSNRYGQEFNAVGGGSGNASGEADCGEGYDRATLRLSDAQLELWNALRALNKPLIGVLVHGRPMCIPEIAGTADAILDLWYPGEAGGQAMAEAIFGLLNPGGRLPISIPVHVGQLPVFYNTLRPRRQNYLDMDSAPLFRFGDGLSYTTFSYSDFLIEPAVISENQNFEVQVTVSNTGQHSGDEVVQLYITDEFSCCSRPERELRAFRRISLAPEESRRVIFTLGREELMFPDSKGNWIVEPGMFTLTVGGSQTPALSGALEVRA